MQVLPSQISPGENFDIFYFFRDPSDSSTHYVQAKIYDLKDGALLGTINLAQAPANSRLFIKTTQAPADAPGYGRNIVTIAAVYSDSAYASPDLNYAEQEQYFLVKNQQVSMGGGGFDMRAFGDWLESALDRRFAALPKPKESPKPTEFPTDALFGTIGKLHQEIGRIPKSGYDDTQLMASLAEVEKAIAALPPAPEHGADFAGINDNVAAVHTAIDELRTLIEAEGPKLLAAYHEAFQKLSQQLVPLAEKALNEFLSKQNLNIPFSEIMGGKKQPQNTRDVSHLMS